MINFINKYARVLATITVWLLIANFLGNIAAIAVSILTLAIYVRRGTETEVLFLFLAMLILGDSRFGWIASFASQAKTGFIVIISAWIAWKSNLKIHSDQNRVIGLFIPFFLYLIVLFPFSFDAFMSMQKVASYILLFFAVPVLTYQASKDDVELFVAELLYFCTVLLGLGLIFYLLGSDVAFLSGRYRGVFGNPNGLGIFLTLLTPLVVFVLDKYPDLMPKNEKWLLIFCVIISLLLSQSRTAIIALVVFFGLRRLGWHASYVGLLVVTLLVVFDDVIYSAIPVLLVNLNLAEYFRLDTLEEGSGRAVAWSFAWEHIQKNYFFGQGFDYTNYLFKAYRSYLGPLGHQGHAHNTFLTFWLDTGIVGLLLFSFGFVRTFMRLSAYATFSFAFFYAILVSINFESWLTASLNPFTIIWLIGITVIILAHENQPSESVA